MTGCVTGTPIDSAHAALEAAGDDGARRMAFYGAVLAAELHLVLEAEPEGDRLRPLVVETEGGAVVLVFDLASRVADFLDRPRDTAALSGRALAAMLAGQGLGIALNPDVAPSASVIGPEAVDWLAAEGGAALEAQAATIRAFAPPEGVPDALVRALEARLGAYGGRVRGGWLAAAEHADGTHGLALALAGVPEAAEEAVAAAMHEAVRFSGAEGVRLDVLFPAPAVLERIARVAIVFRPPPETPETPRPAVPGEGRPPRLR